MAVHNNLKLFYLLLSFSLLLPCPKAQPEVSPSPGPDSSGSPSPGPTSPGPARSPSSSPRPAQGPSQGSGSSPGPSPSPKSALGPSPSSGPAPGPSSDNYIDDETDTQQDDNSNSPSPSIAPSADAPSGSDSPLQFDFSPNLAPVADADPLVMKICHATDYPPICLATVAPYLNGETDIPSVLDVAIQASAQYTKYGQTTAHKLAEHDKTTMNTMLSAIVSFVADCRDANSQDSELYNISDKLIRMTINSLAISAQME